MAVVLSEKTDLGSLDTCWNAQFSKIVNYYTCYVVNDYSCCNLIFKWVSNKSYYGLGWRHWFGFWIQCMLSAYLWIICVSSPLVGIYVNVSSSHSGWWLHRVSTIQISQFISLQCFCGYHFWFVCLFLLFFLLFWTFFSFNKGLLFVHCTSSFFCHLGQYLHVMGIMVVCWSLTGSTFLYLKFFYLNWTSIIS